MTSFGIDDMKVNLLICMTYCLSNMEKNLFYIFIVLFLTIT